MLLFDESNAETKRASRWHDNVWRARVFRCLCLLWFCWAWNHGLGFSHSVYDL
jgi:hypothetical protein